VGIVSFAEERAVCGVTRVSLLDALALGPAPWDGVVTRSPAASPFMSWAWHRAWADAAAPADVEASEALLLRGADGNLQALLPVALRRVTFRRMPLAALTWAVGDAGCPDHLDIPGVAEADLDLLVPALEARPWRILILSNLAALSPNADRLCEALARRGHVARREPLWGCPRLELPGSWEAYLATLSPSRRQTVRRKERSLSRRHRVTLTDYDEDTFETGWRHLVRLHEERWSNAGAFRDPLAVNLQEGFARANAAHGRLWLTTLDLDGVPAAAWYGFASGDTVYFYQSGRDPKWEGESVGLVMMGSMIRRAIERGYRWFDFLRGEDSYKTHWTGTQRKTGEIVVFRSGWRGQWVRALDWAAGITHG
jgi:CelD/BcsL family acetyltransferase involved in cellulose biosynthesis